MATAAPRRGRRRCRRPSWGDELDGEDGVGVRVAKTLLEGLLWMLTTFGSSTALAGAWTSCFRAFQRS
uniref:Uncharacterized protein n=1 Tax=Leersia perrieri TaxID=77586 RepID=A0A0D9W9I0_9ORYZ